MHLLRCRPAALLLFLLSILAACRASGGSSGDKLSFELDWVRRSFSQPPGLSSCGGTEPKGPCVGLVGIQSRADFFDRRALIRQTWLKYRTPGMDFVFVLGLPDDSAPTPQTDTDLLRWEFEAYRDIVVLNTTEVDSYHSGSKTHSTFQWATSLGRGKYLYVAKADDDNIINPMQLRLLMTMLPKRDHVFWGRQYPLSASGDFPLAPKKNIGPINFMSMDVAEALGRQSYEDWLLTVAATAKAKYGEGVTMPKPTEDIMMSVLVQTLVPHEDWYRARSCELYNHHRDEYNRNGGGGNSRYTYNNQTIACHHVKDVSVYAEALGSLLPYMEGMQQDCKEWAQPSQGYATRAYAAAPSPPCRRWLQAACPVGAPLPP